MLYILSTLIYSIILIIFSFALIKGYAEHRVTKKITNSKISFSIIIALKNEQENLARLISSIDQINYPKDLFEIIFIDDHSTDDTFKLLSIFCQERDNCFVYAQNDEFNGKIYAITNGINKSKSEWISLTDADCIIHAEWLNHLASNIENSKNISMIIGFSPEVFLNSFQYFKQIVSAIIYASTAKINFPFGCSGRNLSFLKSDFKDLKCFHGVHSFQTGEDKLLLNIFIKNKKNIAYLPYPPIFTMPASKSKVKNQNIRRYGVFHLNILFWKLLQICVGLALIFIPFEIIIHHNYLPLYLFVFSNILFIVCGCLLHKEKFRLTYFLLAPIFPYYLLYQTIYSLTQKRTSWK